MNRSLRLWACSLLLFSMGPFEMNQPAVAEGNAAYERGDFSAALRAFDEAKRQLPTSAEVEYNRGLSLHKLGRNEEARAALLRAAELDKGKLAAKIHYNLGNVWAATSNKKEAVAEYRKALRKDPNDDAARHNLEVLLKDLPPPQNQNQPDGGQGDAGQDGGSDAGADAGHKDGGTPTDGGNHDGGSPDAGADAGQDGGIGGQDGGSGDGGSGDGGSGKDQKQLGDAGAEAGTKDGGADAGQADPDAGINAEGSEPLDRLDGGMTPEQAKKLLDSMKNSEKNLQLWRFQKKSQRKPSDKDW